MRHKINTVVIVGDATDDTMDIVSVGKKGRVCDHNTNGRTGNTKDDPLHYVEFEDGTLETFWYEELIPQ